MSAAWVLCCPPVETRPLKCRHPCGIIHFHAEKHSGMVPGPLGSRLRGGLPRPFCSARRRSPCWLHRRRSGWRMQSLTFWPAALLPRSKDPMAADKDPRSKGRRVAGGVRTSWLQTKSQEARKKPFRENRLAWQPERIFTHYALLELNFTPYTAGVLFCTCRDMKMKIYTFLHDRQLLRAVFASHRNLRDDEERVQAAYPGFVRQRMPNELRSILIEREHVYCLTRTVPTLALQTLQMRTFQC